MHTDRNEQEISNWCQQKLFLKSGIRKVLNPTIKIRDEIENIGKMAICIVV